MLLSYVVAAFIACARILELKAEEGMKIVDQDTENRRDIADDIAGKVEYTKIKDMKKLHQMMIALLVLLTQPELTVNLFIEFSLIITSI